MQLPDKTANRKELRGSMYRKIAYTSVMNGIFVFEPDQLPLPQT
jgi:hypothetical protein